MSVTEGAEWNDAPTSTIPVLVVIPTLNEAANITRIIAQLDAGPAVAGGPPLIVVADGGSTDGTQAAVWQLAATRPRLKLLHNPQRNQAAAMNLAVATFGAPGGIAIRCDAHAEYPPGYIRSLVDTLERTGADSIVVPMDSIGQNCFGRAVAWVSDTKVGSGGSAHRGGHKSGWIDHGHHAAFLVDSFHANDGGYDEAFVPNEDAEYDCRLAKRGGRVYLDASIRMTYLPRNTMGGVWRQYYRYGRARSMTIRRHPDRARARQLILPAFVLANCAALLAAPAFASTLVLPASYAVILAATSAALAARERSVCGLLAGLAASIMHVAWAFGFLGGLATIRQRRWTNPDRIPATACPGTPPTVALVDASLFTAPYDAALVDGLAKAGVSSIVATRPLRRGERALSAPERTRAIFYRQVDDNPKIPARIRKAAKAFSHIVGLVRLLRLARAERVDVIHFQWNVIPVLDALAIRLLRRHCAVVVTVHDTVPFNGARISLLQRLCSDKPALLADHAIVHTEAGRRLLLERGHHPNRVSVVPHGPIPIALPPTPATRDDQRHTITLFGQIKPHKGVDILLDAVDRMPDEVRRSCRVIVAGTAMMGTNALEAQQAALGLSANVSLRFGRLSEPELVALFEATDTFVFPYRHIDASGAYYTVRGLGKWIVASRVGVFAEDFVEGQDGRLVPTGDASALAAALVEAVTRDARPMPAAPPTTWHEIGARTRAIYENALRRLRLDDGERTHAPEPTQRPLLADHPPNTLAANTSLLDGEENKTFNRQRYMTESNRRIAIIITCYNYGRYVGEAIESALAQVHPADAIVVVDDGSTDDTPDVLAAYASSVTVIRKANGGQTEAIRTGLAATDAGIIQMLDADDRLLPNALIRVAAVWTSRTAKVQFDLGIIDGDGARLGRRYANFSPGYDARAVEASFRRTNTYRWPVMTGNAYARTLVEAGLDMEVPLSLDGVLNTIAPLYGAVATISDSLGEYRLHDLQPNQNFTFGAVRMPPFALRIDQRRAEIKTLITVANRRRQQLAPVDALDHEVLFVNYRMIAKRLGLRHDTLATDRTLRLWRRGIALGLAASPNPRHKLQHVIWFTVLATIPGPLVPKLIAMRFGRAFITTQLKAKLSWQL